MIEELKEASRKLNASSDEFNSVLTDIQKEIQKLGIGLMVWRELISDSSVSKIFVGYARVDNNWTLAIRRVENNETEIWPLLSAPRYLRVRAVKGLRELVIGMTEAAKAFNEKTLQATIESIEILRDLQEIK
jgi:hypothetical protein